MKIVYIDDEEMLLDMYSMKFKEHGFEVITSKNGEDGFEVIKKENPDLIITDIIMPKGDGFYLVGKVKNDIGLKNIPIIALTNLDNEDDRKKMQKLGVKKYIVKSQLTPSELVLKIAAFLEKD